MSVKGGGGVPPKSVTFFLANILSVKGGGGTPLTDKTRKVVFAPAANCLVGKKHLQEKLNVGFHAHFKHLRGLGFILKSNVSKVQHKKKCNREDSNM